MKSCGDAWTGEAWKESDSQTDRADGQVEGYGRVPSALEYG